MLYSTTLFSVFCGQRENRSLGMVANGLHRKAVYDEFDGKGLVSSSLTMFLLYSRDLTEKGQSLKKFVKYIKK